MKSHGELKAEMKTIQKQIAKAKKKERTDALKEVKRLCKEFSFTAGMLKLAQPLVQSFRTYLKDKVRDGETKLNILKSFPMYRVGGEGLYPIVAKLTILSINQTIPALAKFSLSIEKNVAFGETL